MNKESPRSDTASPILDHGLVKGIVFFLSDDPAKARTTLIDLGCRVLDLFQQSCDEKGVASFVKRSKSRWTQFAETASFQSSERFTAARSSARQYKQGQLLMMGASPSPGCLNLPSFLYAELPTDTDDDEIISVMVDAIDSGVVFLALSDLIIADNPKDYPKSASNAVKHLIRDHLAFKRAEDTWLNPEFRASIAKDPVRIFDGPNRIIAVSNEHVEDHLGHLDWESLLTIWRRDIRSALVIYAAADDELEELSRAIDTSVFPIEKPQMFWKKDAWESWKDRFLRRNT